MKIKYQAKSISDGMCWLARQKKIFTKEAKIATYLEAGYTPSYPNKIYLNKVTRVRDVLCDPSRVINDPNMVISWVIVKTAFFTIKYKNKEISQLYRDGNIYYFFGTEAPIEGYCARFCARCGHYLSQKDIDTGICPYCS